MRGFYSTEHRTHQEGYFLNIKLIKVVKSDTNTMKTIPYICEQPTAIDTEKRLATIPIEKYGFLLSEATGITAAKNNGQSAEQILADKLSKVQRELTCKNEDERMSYEIAITQIMLTAEAIDCFKLMQQR